MTARAGPLLGLVASIIAVVGACAAPAPTPPATASPIPSASQTAEETAPASPAVFPVRTMTPEASASGRPCPAALIDGILIEHPTTGLGLQTANGLVGVIWPFGWHGAVGPPAALVDGDGTVIATVGRAVSVGGGFVGDQAWIGCGGVSILD